MERFKPAITAGVFTASLVLSIEVTLADGPKAGEVLRVFNHSVGRFVSHPSKPILYANEYNDGSVLVIDTDALTVVDRIPVGRIPISLAVSPDGEKLFVGDYSGITVIDTGTGNVSNLPLSFRPIDIAYGADHRLWVMNPDTRNIEQLDSRTGSPTGPNSHGVYQGMLKTSLDGRTLYCAASGASPTSLLEFDITGAAARLVWENEPGALGGNGSDLVLSHNGKMLTHVASGGNDLIHPYDIGLFDAASKELLGVLNTGPSPDQLAFSPDDLLAYVVRSERDIDVFSTETSKHLEKWRFAGPYDGDTVDIITDHTGQYLFAAKPNYISVLATGRSIVPEPNFSALPIAMSVFTLHRRRNKR